MYKKFHTFCPSLKQIKNLFNRHGECFEMIGRFSDYFEIDSQDGPESDSDSEFDEYPPPLEAYGNFPNTDGDEDFGDVVHQWFNNHIY